MEEIEPVLKQFVLSCAVTLISASSAAGHSGGLNSEGCHNNRKTGDYHCHRSGTKKAAPAPFKGSESSGTYYRNCTAARAAGAAPVYAGDPGYAAHLDRDNDGVGCE